MKLAIDRQLILDTAYQGYGVLTSDTPEPSDGPFYPPGLGVREPNIEEAKRLLAEAGYPDGIDIELHTAPVVGGIVDMSVAFAKSLEEAGIRVKLNQGPADTYFEQIWTQKPMFVSFYPRQYVGIRIPLGFTPDAPWNETHYPDTPVEGMLAKARSALDPEAQRAAYGEILAWISENEGYFNAAYTDDLYVAKKQFKGYRRRRQGGIILREAHFQS